MQNFAFGGAGDEQDGQRRSSCAPHAMQNFASAGFAVPQLSQVRSMAQIKPRAQPAEPAASPKKPRAQPAEPAASPKEASLRQPARRPTVIWVTPCTTQKLVRSRRLLRPENLVRSHRLLRQ